MAVALSGGEVDWHLAYHLVEFGDGDESGLPTRGRWVTPG